MHLKQQYLKCYCQSRLFIGMSSFPPDMVKKQTKQKNGAIISLSKDYGHLAMNEKHFN